MASDLPSHLSANHYDNEGMVQAGDVLQLHVSQSAANAPPAITHAWPSAALTEICPVSCTIHMLT